MENSLTKRKIKEAAKDLFQKKGYNNTTTREIAKKSKTNPALINYYFGNKQNLFNIIISDALLDLKDIMIDVLNNKKTSFQEKIDKFCDNYFKFIILHPEIHSFLLEGKDRQKDIIQGIEGEKIKLVNTEFARQYAKTTGKGMEDFKHFFMSMTGLMIFPILVSPTLSKILDIDSDEYDTFRKERKNMIKFISKNLL